MPAVSEVQIKAAHTPDVAPPFFRWRSRPSQAHAYWSRGLSWFPYWAGLATVVGRLVPVVGAPVIAILCGIAISLVKRPSARFTAGIAFSSKKVLQGSIVLLRLALPGRGAVHRRPVVAGLAGDPGSGPRYGLAGRPAAWASTRREHAGRGGHGHLRRVGHRRCRCRHRCRRGGRELRHRHDFYLQFVAVLSYPPSAMPWGSRSTRSASGPARPSTTSPP